MICTCSRCLYTFSAASQPEQCPDCGKYAVREATAQEIGEYRRIRIELDRDINIPWTRGVELPRSAVS